MTRAQTLKALRCLGAVALAAAGVWGLRVAARDLLRPPPPPRPQRPPEARVSRPAPRARSLAEAVPEALRLSLGGVPAKRESFHLPVPEDLARAEVAARLEARGWRPLRDDLPLPNAILQGLAGDALYVTPGRAYAKVSLRAEGQGTRVRVFLLPTEGAEPLDLARAPAPDPRVLLREAAGKARLERQLPPWMGALCLGHAVTTQLTERRGGAAFWLTAVWAGGGPAAARRRLAQRAAAGGWLRAPSPADALSAEAPGETFTFDNVACTVRCLPGEGPGETLLCYRFTDDETLAQPFPKETP